MRVGNGFTLNRQQKKPTTQLLFQHLRGISFRSLAKQIYNQSSTAYRQCLSALKGLPHNADISHDYCAKFCGILVVWKYYQSKRLMNEKFLSFMASIISLMISQHIFSLRQRTIKRVILFLPRLNFKIPFTSSYFR